MAGISGGLAGSRSGEAGSIIGESGVFGGGHSDGGVGCEDGEGCKAADGGGEGSEPRMGGGEREISLFSSQSRRCLPLFLPFLGFFIGGGALSGDSMGIASCDIRAAVGAAVGDVAQTGTPSAVVAALLRLRQQRWQQRCFSAAVADSAGTGKVHDKDSV